MSNAPLICQGVVETVGTTAAQSTGTTLANTYTQLVAATAQEWSGFILDVVPNTGIDATISIGLGAAPEFTLVDQLYVPTCNDNGANAFSLFLPLRVPKGSRLAGKCTTNSGAIVQLHGIASPAMFGSFSHLIAMGITGAQRGTLIDPGASANVKGAYVELAASTSKNFGALIAIIGRGNNAALTNSKALVDVGIGAVTEKVLIGDLAINARANTDVYSPVIFGPFPGLIPAGSRLSVRGQSSITDTTDRKFDVALYGCVA